MKISIIIMLAVCLASVLPQQLDENVSEEKESDLAKIVPKLPQSIKDEIFRSSVGNPTARYLDVVNTTKDASEQSYIIGDKNTRRYRVKIKKKTRIGGGGRNHTFSHKEYKKSFKLQKDNQFETESANLNRNSYEHAEENKSDKDINDAKEIYHSYTYSDENITTGLDEEQNYNDAKLSLTEKNMITSDTTENTRQKGVKTICDTLNITSQDIWLIAKKYLGLDIHKSEDFHELENVYKEFLKSVKDGVGNISSFKWFLDNSHKEDPNLDYNIEEGNYPKNSNQFWRNWLKRILKYFTRGFNTPEDITNLLRTELKTLESDNIDETTVNLRTLDEIPIAGLDLNQTSKSELVKNNSFNKVQFEHEVVENSNLEPTESDKSLDTNALIVEESINEYDDKTLPEKKSERVIRPTNNSEHNVTPYNYIDIKKKVEIDPNTNNVIEEELSEDKNKNYSAAANLILKKVSNLPSQNAMSEFSSDNIPELQILKTDKDESIPLANRLMRNNIFTDNGHNIFRDGNNNITKEPSNELNEFQNSFSKSLFNVIPKLEQVNDKVAKNKYFLLLPALILNPRTKNIEHEILSEPTIRILDDEQHDEADTESQINGLLDIRKPNIIYIFLQLTNDILSDTLSRIEVYLIENGRPTAVIKPIIKRIKSEMLMLTQLSFDTTKCLTDNLDLFIEMLKFKIKQHLEL